MCKLSEQRVDPFSCELRRQPHDTVHKHVLLHRGSESPDRA